jgi:hypothetical protein
MNNGLKTNEWDKNEWIKSLFVVSAFFDRKADVVNGHQTSCRRRYLGQEPVMTEIPKNGHNVSTTAHSLKAVLALTTIL